MSFALICIAAIVALGLLVALTSIGSEDEPIVEAHDCATCTSKDDGSCKIACLMEEKRQRDAQNLADGCQRDAQSEKKEREGNKQQPTSVLYDDDA